MNGDLELIKYKFFFETPLYELFELNGVKFNDFFSETVDGYNFTRKTETTYEIDIDTIDSYGWDGYYAITLNCKRYNDKLRFFIARNEDVVVKIGQFPSLADIQFAELGKKYDKFMDREDLQEFKKAIGLSAHGVGAGSFVYLRRIFEKLILAAYRDNKKELDIVETEFIQKRMLDKVRILKDHLPTQLNEMKSIYPILSKGVHELSEQECLEYFPAVKLAIELIIDQKIEMELKKHKDEMVKAQIETIGKKLAREE